MAGLKRKTRKTVYDVLAQLGRFDVDTPISIEGDVYERRVFKQLETLRRNLRDARDRHEQESANNKVMIASIVHDLKTPLAIISGYAECMKDGIDDKDYLTLIMQKTQEMNEQVLELISAYRQEAQELAECKESIEISEFFKGEAEKYVKLAKEKKITYIIGHAPYVTIYAGRSQLARVFQNLVSNAIKYTPYGGRIKVMVRRASKEIRIIVKDNGQGISKESLPLIFDKFYMEDKARTISGSTGLGLYISKEIVTDCGGEINVKSKKGRGSKFIVRLPVESDGKIRKSITARFNALPRPIKFVLFLVFGFALSSAYRFQRYYETRQKDTLKAALFFIPFFLMGWMVDLTSLMLSNRITMLAD